MATLIRIVIGFLLVAHGLVHLLYLTPDVPKFSLDRSWLVPETASGPVAMVLMWATWLLLPSWDWQFGVFPGWPWHGRSSP
jgi:hypothetical protein